MNDKKKNGVSGSNHYHSFGGSKQGTIAAVAIALVLVIVLLFNLIIRQLPSNIMEIDISDKKIYTISDVSKDFLEGIDQDINVIMLSQEGAEDPRIVKFLENYAALSPHINFSIVDPVLYPSILEQYDTEDGTIVVENTETGKHTAIEMFGYSNAMFVYNVDIESYRQYEDIFDGEGLLTSAINYVTSETTNNVYTLSGHEEDDLPNGSESIIQKANLTVNDLDLLLDGGIPDDCDSIICYNPQSDLSDDELRILRDYLLEGGNVVLLIDRTDLENFNSLLDDYGLKLNEGYVGDEDMYYSNYYSVYGYNCFAPDIEKFHDVTNGLENTNAMVINARGMTEMEPVRDTIVLSSFMTTSDNGVLSESGEKGKYTIGITATEEVTNEEGEAKEASLTVISAPTFIQDEITTYFNSLSNLDVFINALTFNLEDYSSIAIDAKDVAITYNTVSNSGTIGIVFIVVVPLAVLAFGLVRWISRRKN